MKSLFLILILGYSVPALADQWTHQLGNSGYAVREAMLEGAAKKSPALYWQAVKVQRQARVKFLQHDLKESFDLSKKAEELAKSAQK